MLYKRGIIRALQELKGRTATAAAIRNHMQENNFPPYVPWQNEIFLKILSGSDFIRVGNSYRLSELYKQKRLDYTRKHMNKMAKAGVYPRSTTRKKESRALLVSEHSSNLLTMSSVDRVFEDQVVTSELALKRAETPTHQEYMTAIVDSMSKLDDKTGFGHYLRDIKDYLLAHRFSHNKKTWRNDVFHQTLEAGVARGDFVRMENYFKFSDAFLETKLKGTSKSAQALCLRVSTKITE